MSQPWTEKYRPNLICDIQNQDNIIETIRMGIDKSDLPHLLLYGSPGTGKTSTALAVCNEIYKNKSDLIRNVLELNASDERGIDVVRSKIKAFSQTRVNNYPFKILILDEVDTMTYDAQAALRRTMEVYSSTTRFILMCNYLTRIIQPITSRCAKFRFNPISISSTVKFIKDIYNKEGYDINNDIILKVASLAEGDLRRAVNIAQVIPNLDLTIDEIPDIMGCIPHNNVRLLWENIKDLNFSIDDLVNKTIEINKLGYPMKKYIQILSEIIISDNTITSFIKGNICKIISDVDMKLSIGCSHEVHIIGLVLEARTFIE